ncbi:peptidoglycan-N-acetylmuramic acid deacetylase [Paenibacillus taihuensis]|uniref:Peptidoglycan-N-acetylmuramic acid deacetylase n=2 Tax=Paenibacillus taihuensis TaxID=1156355 RepID=A0A3D9S1K5_9BACL|nr:peptidoglycan-N-acetylmuramic acid deacetylase [Paenibacillus taihuensis]
MTMRKKRAVLSATLTAMLLALLLTTGLSAHADANENENATVAPTGGPYHFGFKKSVGGALPSIKEEGFQPILEQHGAIFLGDTKQKELYLTFDNGYENGYTPRILDVLKEKSVPAIFFVTGHYVKDKPELVKRMVAEGHLVGNHSWSHPDMSVISSTQISTELSKVKTAVAELTGQQEMTYLRPPRGIFNSRVLAVSKEQGYTSVFWSVAYRDWEPSAQKGWRYAYDNVMKQLHPGAVILLHSVSKDNTEALGAIIDAARQQGYTFKPLNELATKSY